MTPLVIFMAVLVTWMWFFDFLTAFEIQTPYMFVNSEIQDPPRLQRNFVTGLVLTILSVIMLYFFWVKK